MTRGTQTKLWRPATIRDVAAELGLSVSTVSRAFTRPDMLNSETVQRVRRAADQLGYQANLPARDLRTRSTGLIFVIVPSLHPFFLEVMRGIEDEAREAGFTIVMGHTGRDPVREAAYFDQVASGRADGVVLVSSVRRGAIARDPRRLPPTVIALEGVDGPELPTIRVDNALAAKEATSYLIGLGHKRLIHIAGPKNSPMARRRKEGFLAAMAEADLPADAGVCLQGQSTVASGQKALKSLLTKADRATAVFAANDEMAVGAIRAAKECGLKVPQDLSVVGFNDHGLAQIYDPPISTIRVPTYDLGRRAMRALRRVLAGDDVRTLHEVMPTEFIERSTTMPPAKN